MLRKLCLWLRPSQRRPLTPVCGCQPPHSRKGMAVAATGRPELWPSGPG